MEIEDNSFWEKNLYLNASSQFSKIPSFGLTMLTTCESSTIETKIQCSNYVLWFNLNRLSPEKTMSELHLLSGTNRRWQRQRSRGATLHDAAGRRYRDARQWFERRFAWGLWLGAFRLVMVFARLVNYGAAICIGNSCCG